MAGYLHFVFVALSFIIQTVFFPTKKSKDCTVCNRVYKNYIQPYNNLESLESECGSDSSSFCGITSVEATLKLVCIFVSLEMLIP